MMLLSCFIVVSE